MSRNEKLNHFERKLLINVASGNKNQIISEKLGISEGTVKLHLQIIGQKLDTHNRTHSVVKAISQGIISLEEIPMSKSRK